MACSWKDGINLEKFQHTGWIQPKNHSGAIPRYIVALDTETTRTPDGTKEGRATHSFRLGCAISCRMRGLDPTSIKRHRLNTPQDLADLIVSLTGIRHTVWIVAHKMMFDFVVSCMPDSIEKGDYSVEWPRSVRKSDDDESDERDTTMTAIIADPPTIIPLKCRETQGRFVLLDTMNYFRCSLSKLGDDCGLEKFKMPAFGACDDIWYHYCERDTEIVLCAFVELIRWVKNNDMGMFRYTAAAQAMAAFRHSFSTYKVYIHDNVEIKQLERFAYYGGRTECFRLGRYEATCYQLDVSSLFPSVMANRPYPSKLVRYDTDATWQSEVPSIDPSRSVATVELQTDRPIYPMRTDKVTIYPVGNFCTTLAGPELQQAVDSGEVVAWSSWAEYELRPLFSSYVSTLWSMRKEYADSGQQLYANLCKLMLNSLYGKFAQLSPEWIGVDGRIADEAWHKWYEYKAGDKQPTEYRSIGYHVQRREERTEISSTFVAIPAFVTAHARIVMNGYRQMAGQANVLYQGVDSLIVNETGFRRLNNVGAICDNMLGKLRLECQSDGVNIVGCSDYSIAGKRVVAGVARDGVTLNDTDIEETTLSATGGLFSHGNRCVVIEDRGVWRRRSNYSKGVVNELGFVSPITLDLAGHR